MEKIVDILFNGFSIAGIILGLYLLFSGLKLKYVKTFFLKAWLVVIIAQITFYLLNINDILQSGFKINYFGFPLSMLHMPLFYLAINDLIRIRKITVLEIILHVSVYVMYVVGLFWMNAITTENIQVINGFLNLPSGLPKVVYSFIGTPLALSGFIYSVLCLITMIQYKKFLKANLSNTDKYQLNWISYLVWAIVILFVLIYLVIVARTDYMFTRADLTFKLVNIFLFFFLLVFGVKYQRQHIYFIKHNVELLKAPFKRKYSHSALSREDMQRISDKLEALMTSEKLYLDEYLSLQKVSDIMQESTQNISQTLNEYLNINFYNYVNNLRLDLVKERLHDPQYSNLSIVGIAVDCGFKSKSTFYKLFKQKTGKTPSEYKNLS